MDTSTKRLPLFAWRVIAYGCYTGRDSWEYSYSVAGPNASVPEFENENEQQFIESHWTTEDEAWEQANNLRRADSQP